jgi:hypothetical protein
MSKVLHYILVDLEKLTCLEAVQALRKKLPVHRLKNTAACALGYNEFDFFLENKEYRPFDGCKIEI